jgi:hypothetical protein
VVASETVGFDNVLDSIIIELLKIVSDIILKHPKPDK